MRNDNETADLTAYVFRVKDIETVTGLDFFNKLPEDRDESVVEAVNKTGEFWDNSGKRQYGRN